LVYENPFAFALAACLDRGIPAEVAWTFPLWIKNELGHLDPHRIAGMSLEEIGQVLDALPRRPRYRSASRRTVKEMAQLVVEEFGGDASRLWTGRTSKEVENSFRKVYGVGPGIASMVVLLLEKVFKVDFDDRDHRTMDVKPDVHVIRVFSRLGLMRESIAATDGGVEPDCKRNSSADAKLAIRVARRLHPEFPAKLDTALWRIGRTWCHASSPDCAACRVVLVCPKEGLLDA
jgi:endonuclease III